MLGREDTADFQFGQGAQVHDGGQCRADFASALFDDAFLKVVGIDRFVERAAGFSETPAEEPDFRLGLAANCFDLCALFGRQAQDTKQAQGIVASAPAARLMWGWPSIGIRTPLLPACGHNARTRQQHKRDENGYAFD